MKNIDWDEWEEKSRIRREKSYAALVDKQDIIKTAAEDAAHWNRMYRELLQDFDEFRKNIQIRGTGPWD